MKCTLYYKILKILNFIKLNDQAEKLIKLNFRMVNLNANMVDVNNKSYNIFRLIVLFDSLNKRLKL